RRRDLGNRAHLVGEVGGQQVDVAGEVLPGAGGAGDVGLAAEPSLDANFAGDVGHLLGKRRQRVGHVVDGFGQRRDLALRLDRQFLPQVAVGHRGHDLDDAADLVGEVGGHDVDRVGQVFPGAGDAGDLGLAAELAFGPDLARDTGDLGGEGAELVDHRVDGVLQLEDLALDVDRDLPRHVAAGDRGRDLGDVADLRRQVRAHDVDRVGEVLPRAGDTGDDRLDAEAALGADLAGDARDLGGERSQLLDHRVDGLLELQDLAANVDRDLARQVAVGDRDRDLGDVAHLAGQVRRHRVDVVGQVLPRAGNAGHQRLAAQLPFGADLARDAADFRRKRVQLVDHRVQGVLQLEEFTLDVNRDPAGEVATGDRG